MSKKKPRKRSKAEIRKAWSENRRRENRRKGAVEAQESRQETYRARYIASADPNEGIPWCKNCRAHTHYDTEMSWNLVYDDPDDTGEDRHRIAKIRRDQCLQCKGKVVTPAQIKGDENALFFTLGVIPLLLVVVMAMGLLFDSNKALAVGLLITVAIAISGLAYCAYRGQLSPSYHSWLQWAKEHKDNETK